MYTAENVSRNKEFAGNVILFKVRSVTLHGLSRKKKETEARNIIASLSSSFGSFGFMVEPKKETIKHKDGSSTEIEAISHGDGNAPVAGQYALVHYDVLYETGENIISTLNTGDPFEFQIQKIDNFTTDSSMRKNFYVDIIQKILIEELCIATGMIIGSRLRLVYQTPTYFELSRENITDIRPDTKIIIDIWLVGVSSISGQRP